MYTLNIEAKHDVKRASEVHFRGTSRKQLTEETICLMLRTNENGASDNSNSLGLHCCTSVLNKYSVMLVISYTNIL